MKSNESRLVPTIGWLTGGFVVSVLALFSMFGGFILAMLMVVATPLILACLAIEAVFGKRPVYITSVKAEEKVPAVPSDEAPARHLSAQVIYVEGACPLGHPFEVGDRWSLNGNVEGERVLCPRAERLLREAAARLKDGEEVRCVGSGYRVVFALQEETCPQIPALSAQASSLEREGVR